MRSMCLVGWGGGWGGGHGTCAKLCGACLSVMCGNYASAVPRESVAGAGNILCYFLYTINAEIT